MNIEILEEKIKYLLIAELPKNYKLLSVEIDASVVRKKGEDFVVEYFLHIRLDNYNSVDTFPEEICAELNKTSELLRTFNNKYKIGLKGKINKDVDEWEEYYPKLFASNYSFDEKNESYFTTGGMNG